VQAWYAILVRVEGNGLPSNVKTTATHISVHSVLLVKCWVGALTVIFYQKNEWGSIPLTSTSGSVWRLVKPVMHNIPSVLLRVLFGFYAKESNMAKRKQEIVFNLVRSSDSDTYEVVSNVDMHSLYSRYNIVREKAITDGVRHGYFYIKIPK